MRPTLRCKRDPRSTGLRATTLLPTPNHGGKMEVMVCTDVVLESPWVGFLGEEWEMLFPAGDKSCCLRACKK